MNSKIIKYIILALVACLAAFIGGCSHGRGGALRQGRAEGYAEGYEAGYNAPHQADTTFVADTTADQDPVPSSVTPAGFELVPIGTVDQLLALADSLARATHDTTEIYIPVPIERLEYKKPDYHLIISGYHPRVEMIEVYPTTAYINNYIDRPVPVDRPVPYSWTLSATADVLAMPGLLDARAGLRYDQQLSGALRGHLEGGYHYGTLGHGIYGQAGLDLTLFHNRR